MSSDVFYDPDLNPLLNGLSYDIIEGSIPGDGGFKLKPPPFFGTVVRIR